MKASEQAVDLNPYDEYDHEADSVIDSGYTPSLSWIIWICAGLFYLYEYVLRVSPGVMTNQLMQDFGVTSTALGVLASDRKSVV